MHQAHYATKLISCMQTPCTTEKSGNFTWQGIICMQRCVSCHVFSTRPYVHSSFLPATWDGVVKHKCDQECHNHVQGHESVHCKIKLKYRKWKINSSALEIKRWVEMHEPTTDKCSYIKKWKRDILVYCWFGLVHLMLPHMEQNNLAVSSWIQVDTAGSTQELLNQGTVKHLLLWCS